MRFSKELISKVYESTQTELGKTNWKKRRSGIFTLDVNTEALGWLGLNTAQYQDGIAINPVVGVRHQKLETLIAEYLQLKESSYSPATLGMNIGYLMPDNRYVTWSFRENGDCKALVVQMVAAIEKFGRPFIERNSTLETIHNTLLESKRGTPPDPLDYRIAVASLLLGRRAEAESFVDAKLQEIGNRTDAAAEYFKNFAMKIRANAAGM